MTVALVKLGEAGIALVALGALCEAAHPWWVWLNTRKVLPIWAGRQSLRSAPPRPRQRKRTGTFRS